MARSQSYAAVLPIGLPSQHAPAFVSESPQASWSSAKRIWGKKDSILTDFPYILVCVCVCVCVCRWSQLTNWLENSEKNTPSNAAAQDELVFYWNSSVTICVKEGFVTYWEDSLFSWIVFTAQASNTSRRKTHLHVKSSSHLSSHAIRRPSAIQRCEQPRSQALSNEVALRKANLTKPRKLLNTGLSNKKSKGVTT